MGGSESFSLPPSPVQADEFGECISNHWLRGFSFLFSFFLFVKKLSTKAELPSESLREQIPRA